MSVSSANGVEYVCVWNTDFFISRLPSLRMKATKSVTVKYINIASFASYVYVWPPDACWLKLAFSKYSNILNVAVQKACQECRGFEEDFYAVKTIKSHQVQNLAEHFADHPQRIKCYIYSQFYGPSPGFANLALHTLGTRYSSVVQGCPWLARLFAAFLNTPATNTNK